MQLLLLTPPFYGHDRQSAVMIVKIEMRIGIAMASCPKTLPVCWMRVYPQTAHARCHSPSSLMQFQNAYRVSAYPVRLGGVKEGIRADRAGRKVPAFVRWVLVQVHAGVAVHAVAGINAQALPQAAEVAERAVVDISAGLVIPQIADCAIVSRHPLSASTAACCTAGMTVKRFP